MLHLYYHQYKSILFWIVASFHICLFLLLSALPLLVKQRNHIKIVLGIYLLIAVQWVVLGGCILTKVEYQLDPARIPVPNYSYFIEIDRFFGIKNSFIIFTALFVVMVCLLARKLYNC